MIWHIAAKSQRVRERLLYNEVVGISCILCFALELHGINKLCLCLFSYSDRALDIL